MIFIIRLHLVMVKLSNGQRLIGFRFVLPQQYPFEAPLAYLDEPENPLLREFIDYLDAGNKIMFAYLEDWQKKYSIPNAKHFSLQLLLCKIYQLYC
jgi:hypothetical protein